MHFHSTIISPVIIHKMTAKSPSGFRFIMTTKIADGCLSHRFGKNAEYLCGKTYAEALRQSH